MYNTTVRYREATPQLDVFSLLSHEQAVTQVVKGINKLSKVIDWELFREELESVLGYIVDPEKVVFQLSDLG
jgi:hypothetical protein